LLGGAAELLLASQRISAGVASSRGFHFRYHDIAATIKDLIAKP
jgi:NAD dependent epimerase/dehydratase family enzyme